MRFNSTQLRMLQESLAPVLPTLSAPPEMVAAAHHGTAHAHLPPHPHASSDPCRQTVVPGWLLPSSYACCLLATGLAWGCCSSHVRVLAASPMPLLLFAHALSTSHSRAAQVLGLVCSVLLPAACMPPWSDRALLGASVLCSAFFAAATQGPPLLKSILAALAILAVILTCATLLAEPAPPARQAVALSIAAVVSAQALASAARIGQFRVICSER